MDARAITAALGGKWAGSYGLARCPVHADRTPSLKVKDDPRKEDGIDVICFAGCDWKLIKDELRKSGLLPQFEPGTPKIEPRRLLRTAEAAASGTILPPEDDAAQRVDRALKIWEASKPIAGTLGEKYFIEHRGIDSRGIELDHAIRYHAGFGAIIALMTDPSSGEPIGIHRTFLEPDGSKRERKMLGRQGVVRVSPDEDVTMGLFLTEGIEDALSLLVSGRAPAWAATSAGAMARFPVLDGIEALTVIADNDKNGVGQRAATECADRWAAAGREVFVR